MTVADRHDVVIVGAGASGCVLAARLAERGGRTVLLLEAGPAPPPDALPAALWDERTLPQDHLWSYDGLHGPTDATPVTVVRGRVVGGSGAVNGMIHQRGLPEEQDAWGVPGWSAAALEPAFARVERDLDAGDRTGRVPLRRLGREHWAPSHRALHDAARDLGAPANPDLLHAHHQGVGPYARNADGGRRLSAAATYLAPALRRPTLTVRGDAHVERVVVDRGRATGVDVVLDGRRRRIDAGEVVLAAGAIETPQLLTHSGIAARADLDRLGIVPVVELPGVGAGLSDHPSVVLAVRFGPAVRHGDPRFLVGLVHTSARGALEGRRSDLQTLVMSGTWIADGHLPPPPDPRTVDGVVTPILYAPESTGRVEVVADDPRRRPRVHYGYLEPPGDRERLRDAVRHAARMLEHDAFAAIVVDPGTTPSGIPDRRTLEDDALLDRWIRGRLRTTLHGCGTCRMGPDGDPAAVVDADCRVRGVDGLRIVDLSIVPRAPSAPTHALALAIAEHAADRI
ncbi:MAG: GMC family oxidoreductase N-terminal domain-containing protein [Solirubrobacteraceae bacterium]|nr:GMC family oxidoreductase N-terminal domain-containing protein [Solirubrobacteraceae bacterium]